MFYVRLLNVGHHLVLKLKCNIPRLIVRIFVNTTTRNINLLTSFLGNLYLILVLWVPYYVRYHNILCQFTDGKTLASNKIKAQFPKKDHKNFCEYSCKKLKTYYDHYWGVMI